MVFLKQRLNMFEWFLHFPANLRRHSNDKYLYNCVLPVLHYLLYSIFLGEKPQVWHKTEETQHIGSSKNLIGHQRPQELQMGP
jgi:hypothetical protein